MRRVFSGVVVGLLAIVAAGCSLGSVGAAPPQQEKTGTPVPAPQKAGAPAGQARTGTGTSRVVNAAQATEGQIKLVFTYTGTVQPRAQVNVVPKTSGRLEQMLVDVGSEVKEGDPIAVLERNALQLSLQQAEANLKSVQARLATVSAGGRPEDITSAEAALSGAQARLNQVRSGPTPSDLQAAQSAVDSARANLASAQARLESVKAGPTPSDLASAQSAVDSARANLKSAETKLTQVKSGPTVLDLQTAQVAVADAKSKLASAQDVYVTALDNLPAVASKVTSVSQAAEAVRSAQAVHDAAQQKLTQLQAGATAVDLQSAQSAYDSARASLEAATARVEQVRRGATAQDLQVALSTVESAQATLVAAEARLAQLQRGPTDDELAVVQATVAQAEQTLALRQRPYTAQDLQSAQAAVDVAKVALATANANLADTTLVAPFSGIITQRLLSPGAMASAQSGVVTLVGADLEILLSVEESRLANLKPGLSVAIAVPAYPGQTFSGRVASIAPSADVRSHTFLMKVVPDNTGGKLKAGMFAEMKITAEERKGILVPRDAVAQRSGKNVVFVISDGRAQMREVVQGLPQEDNVEIVSGVKGGEQVIVVGHSGLNDGDPVRAAGAPGAQPSDQPGQQQQRQQMPQSGTPGKTQQQPPGAPGKTQQ